MEESGIDIVDSGRLKMGAAAPIFLRRSPTLGALSIEFALERLHSDKMYSRVATNERDTERQRSALDRVESICVQLASSTNVDALRKGLAEILLLIAGKRR
jgi:hypothetical protein